MEVYRDIPIAGAAECLVPAFDPDGIGRKPGTEIEGSSGAPLAMVAMAHGDSDGIPFTDGFQLAAVASGFVCGHRGIPPRLFARLCARIIAAWYGILITVLVLHRRSVTVFFHGWNSRSWRQARLWRGDR